MLKEIDKRKKSRYYGIPTSARHRNASPLELGSHMSCCRTGLAVLGEPARGVWSNLMASIKQRAKTSSGRKSFQCLPRKFKDRPFAADEDRSKHYPWTGDDMMKANIST